MKQPLAFIVDCILPTVGTIPNNLCAKNLKKIMDMLRRFYFTPGKIEM